MSETAIALVEDPELRASLRLLYPEYHPTVQAYLIAEPGAPLPALVDYSLPIFTSVEARDASLVQSLEILQRQYPESGWTVEPFRVLRGEARGLTRPDPNGTGSYRAQLGQALPDGSVIEHRFTPDSGGALNEDLLFVVGYGGLLRVDLGQQRTVGLDTDEGLYLHVGSRVAQGASRPGRVAFVGREELEEILADGSPDALSVQSYDSAEPPPILVPSSTQVTRHDEDVPSDEDVDILLRRWHRLPTPADQARVTQFWLGHPHPVLAAAGLATLPAAPQPRL
jgi:hypothetical protein